MKISPELQEEPQKTVDEGTTKSARSYEDQESQQRQVTAHDERAMEIDEIDFDPVQPSATRMSLERPVLKHEGTLPTLFFHMEGFRVSR